MTGAFLRRQQGGVLTQRLFTGFHHRHYAGYPPLSRLGDAPLSAWQGDDTGTEEVRTTIQQYRAFWNCLEDFPREACASLAGQRVDERLIRLGYTRRGR